MKMKPVTCKIFFITLLGIFIFLIALESSLRIGGELYIRHRDSGLYAKITETERNAFRILCLGDSYTYGAGDTYDNSYPSQLEVMLNSIDTDRKIVVKNLGSPGGNSCRILKIFTENIDTHKPDIAVIMVGMNNAWNLEGMQRFNRLPLLNKLKIDIHDLRLYKLCKLLSINFRKKISMESDADDRRAPRANLQNDVAADKWKELKEKVKFHRETGRSDLAMQELSSALDEYPNGYGEMVVFLREMSDYDLALNYAKKALQYSPQNLQNNAWLHLELVYIYGAKKDWLLARKEMDYAVRDISAIQSVFPEMNNICNNESGLDFKVESDKIRTLIAAIHGKNGTRIWDTLMYLEKNQEERSRILASDLSALIKIASERGVRLILMTYPVHASVNDIILKTAAKNGIDLVDNESIFNAKTDKDKFFAPDRHCNGRGYEVVAGNVYSRLLKMGVFSEI
ncbi:MAG: SGNH/GDSL hydrolase family protein [Candidatus Omnitrophica bacterium]|nr:SGNH/GDSL hydrolase family protein [Candidatus Omnitrophota bacterium]